MATSVDLSHNRITNLTSCVFSHLSACRNLSIAYNLISSVEPGAFNGLINLTILILTRNHIPRLDADINLEELNLRKAGITWIQEGAFRGLTNVKYLNLNENHLNTKGPGMFAGLSSCDKLSLLSNYISQVQPRTFECLSSCRYLHLEYNSLIIFPYGY